MLKYEFIHAKYVKKEIHAYKLLFGSSYNRFKDE